jgi:hypothetical protein
VAWFDADGKRKVRQFGREQDALDEASVIAGNLAVGKIDAAGMTREDRDMMVGIRDICGKTSPLAALQEWKKIRGLVGDDGIAAAEHWAKKQAVRPRVSLAVNDCVDSFIAAKNLAGFQGTRIYKAKLKPLVDSFSGRPIDSITAKELEAYLQRFEDAVTRNDYRKRAVALWRWARVKGHLPKDASLAIEETERAREKIRKIGIIDAKIFSAALKWVQNNQPEDLAALVLAGFCGIRSDEIHGKRNDRGNRQKWEDVKLDRKFVTVSNVKENTPAWRIVPLCDAAVEWLRLCPGDHDGNVCRAAAMEQVRKGLAGAGFKLPENCFRHSYISPRIAALDGNKPQVATEAGNSVGEIDRRYRVPLPKDEGVVWFAIHPVMQPPTRRMADVASPCTRTTPLS